MSQTALQHQGVFNGLTKLKRQSVYCNITNAAESILSDCCHIILRTQYHLLTTAWFANLVSLHAKAMAYGKQVGPQKSVLLTTPALDKHLLFSPKVININYSLQVDTRFTMLHVHY